MPLLVVEPRGSARVVSRLVQSIDVAPTILELASAKVPGTFEGRSLVPLQRGDSTAWNTEREELNFSQIRRFNLKWALRTPRHKLIYNQTPETDDTGMPVRAGFEFYDLVTDPQEQRNVYDPDDPETRELMSRLRQLIEDRPDYGTSDAPLLTDEERKRLEALGYAG